MNTCYFCDAEAHESYELCTSCFLKAWRCAVINYETKDINKMMHLAQRGLEGRSLVGEALTIRYETKEKKNLGDISEAEIIIDDYETIGDITKYDRLPRFFRGRIDLSIGMSCAFWTQADDFQQRNKFLVCYMALAFGFGICELGALMESLENGS